MKEKKQNGKVLRLNLSLKTYLTRAVTKARKF